jgi:hypothetical protein
LTTENKLEAQHEPVSLTFHSALKKLNTESSIAYVIKDLPNPAPEWISVRSWLEITTTQVLDKFTNFSEEFKNHLDGFKRIFDSMTPHRYVSLTL